MYYLLPQLPDSDFRILQQLGIETHFGEVEIAIIGSSHFFYLKNIFCEILTCKTIDNEIPCIILEQLQNSSFRYQQLINKIHYDFSLEVSALSSAEFNEQIWNLTNQKNLLIQSFHHESALTIINISTNSATDLTVSTWHTYPENDSIVKSTTKIS